MAGTIRPHLSHAGIYVRDLDRMERFYTDVMGLVVTDRGQGVTFKHNLVFMSSDPGQHHEFVLSDGRPADAAFSTVMQMSFKVGSLDELRAVHRRAVAEPDCGDPVAVDHGNAWSIYFGDPEGNTIEVYLDSPWHVPQPHAARFDIERPSAAIMADTLARIEGQDGFMPREAFAESLRARLEGGN